MTVLENLYSGNIHPAEKYVKKGSRYDKLTLEQTELIEALRCKLSSEQKHLFDKIEDKTLELCSVAEEERFIDGFQLGAAFVLDILFYKSKNFTELAE